MRRRLTVPISRVARSPWLPWILSAVAFGLAVGFFLLWNAERLEDERRAEAERAATRLLVALTNFSGETIESDVAEIRSYATGTFAEEVDETFSEERLDAIREEEVSSTGEVRSVFIQTLEGSTATAFGVVDETTTNRSSPEPATGVLRIEVGLVETTEGWRISEVEILQSPQQPPLAP